MPVYKTKSGILTNLPGPDAPGGIDPNDPTTFGMGSSDPVTPTSWEGQGALDAAKQTLADTTPEAATLDQINATLFPRAAAAKAANPTLYQGVVGSHDYADLESQLQHQEDTAHLQSSPMAQALDYVGPGTIATLAGVATPFVGPEVTVPTAVGATTLLDLAKSHYHSPDAPANGSNYLGDVAESAAGPALVAGGEYALSKAPLLNKPGVVPGVVGAVHGYHRAGVLGAIEEGLGGYYGGKVLDKITGRLSALKRAAALAPKAAAAVPEAEAAVEDAATPLTRNSTASFRQATYSGTQTPTKSVDEVLRQMGGNFSVPKFEYQGAPTYSWEPPAVGGTSIPGGNSYDPSQELNPQAIEAAYQQNHPRFQALKDTGMFGGDRTAPVTPSALSGLKQAAKFISEPAATTAQAALQRSPTIQYNNVVYPRNDLLPGEFLQQLKASLALK